MNVIDVPNEKNLIIKAIDKVLNDTLFQNSLKKIKNPYGNGDSSKKIVSILKRISLKKFNSKTLC